MQKAARRVHAPIEVGDTFGNQLVVAVAPQTTRDRKFIVRCACGNERPIFGHVLKATPPTVCNECRWPRPKAGQVFGKLTVVGEGDPINGSATARCHCECGNVKDIRYSKLFRGEAKTCFNCSSTFGLSLTPEYEAWSGMVRRCTDPSNRSYVDYGGRGISVCPEWRDSFSRFLQDMGHRPSPKHSLDRWPDINGDYRPGNCRWATATQQVRNRRMTVMVDTPQGVVPLAQACEAAGQDYSTVYQRIHKLGWSAERALSQPNRLRRQT